MNASQQAAQAATDEATRKLELAYGFVSLHATGKPLFDGVMKAPGDGRWHVRAVWPGVLVVFDPLTGDVLAQSEHGQPHRLKAGFVPGPVALPVAHS